MPTLIAPTATLVTDRDVNKLKRGSVTGWLRESDGRQLAPTFHFGPEESKSVVTEALEQIVSQQIGAPITGPRQLSLADRLAFADFTFRDTRRKLPVQTIAYWMVMPAEIDWTMRLYCAAWHSYLTAQRLTGMMAWQADGILPVTALRRMRERLLQDAVGVLTRLELIEFVKHLDTLSAEW
jgi:hypothetical protein